MIKTLMLFVYNTALAALVEETPHSREAILCYFFGDLESMRTWVQERPAGSGK
jgi:hypothetical protein